MSNVTDLGPQILFPPDGAEILATGFGQEARGFHLAARSTAGQTKFYVDGQALKPQKQSLKVIWYPKTAGFYRVSAVDEKGRETVSRVKILTPDQLANTTF